MKKIEASLDVIRKEIFGFYKEDQHHFIVMNGVDHGDKMEIQWFFFPYKDENELTMFSTTSGYDETIPSMVERIPSAWCAEAEFVDLFGMKIENTKGGFFLEFDHNEGAPLRRKK